MATAVLERQLRRDGLTGADVRTDGWDIGRWFGVVVVAAPGSGSCDAVRRSRGASSPPRSHRANASARTDQTEPGLPASTVTYPSCKAGVWPETEREMPVPGDTLGG
jgi:hypothetical protein